MALAVLRTFAFGMRFGRLTAQLRMLGRCSIRPGERRWRLDRRRGWSRPAAAADGAKPLSENGFNVELVKRTVERQLAAVAGQP
jgi:hypothetical protein